MRGSDRTTRQRIADQLRTESASAGRLAAEFGIAPASALSHVEHVARSLEGTGEQLLAAPPTCRDCDFDGFDDVANLPSRCPRCKSERVAEPVFAIEDA